MKGKRGKKKLKQASNTKTLLENKEAQLTIFIIIAIILIASVAGFFLIKGSLNKIQMPQSIEPVYITFLSCLEEDVNTGVSILESQGGYIELPEFEPGSRYMPFSSQLNFLGNPIPYWYYVSGNGVEKEQVPSKKEMENQLEDFIEEKARTCVFDNYYRQGFEIIQGKPDAKVTIKNDEILLNLDMNLNIDKGDESVIVSNHKLNIKTSLGKLYDSALKVYQYEQDKLFLENYSVDTLRMHAPVDGVELNCSAKVWNAQTVFDDLKEAIESNTLALKSKGSSKDYFVIDAPVENVRFINSQSWANSFEVNPSEGMMLVAKPVGNQAGLGVLGFCYVPYHFVYNVKYPVLVQVYNNDEIFQFPIAVVIQGNKPRKPLDATAIGIQSSQICNHQNTLTEIRIYDVQGNSVDAEISYECFGESCSIGGSNQGFLQGELPQCINGFITARAEGFEEKRQLYSSVQPGSVNVVLDRLYERDIELKIDGMTYNKPAIISFVKESSSKTIMYPSQKSIELSGGQYEVQVYVYSESNINLQESSYRQCVDVPSGIMGVLFGSTKEKCFDVMIPSQIISNALSGGGKENYYILESELKSSNTIEIKAESLPLPTNLDELQNNYLLFEDKELEIIFR
jgi:hypothetical protein